MANKSFHITVGVAPSGKIDVHSEIQMIKAALLYGDNVRLCSPTSTMLTSIVLFGQVASASTPKQQVEYFEELLPSVVRDKTELPPMLAVLQQYKSLIHKKRLQKTELLLKMRLKSAFKRMWEEIRGKAFEMAENAGLEEILMALESGLLELELIGGETEEYTDNMIQHYFDAISEAITGYHSYPLLDDQTGNLIKASIREGRLEVPDHGIARSKHLGLVSHLLDRLPLFDLAKVEEVLDIRRELDRPLIRFRSGMIGFSERISSAQWDAEFEAEAEQIFLRDVQPAILEIEDAIKSNSYLRSLVSKYSDKPQILSVPLLALVMSQYSSLPEIVSLALGTATLSATAFKVYSEWKEKQQDIEQNHLFLYYKAQELLKR